MSKTPWIAALTGLFLISSVTRAQDESPILRLDSGGPTGLVTGLAMTRDGKTLYATGWDKVVRVWKLDVGVWKEAPALRVPIGPGADGKLNALALSEDGLWLAVGGSAKIRGRTGFRQTGMIVPAATLDDETRRDQGTIYLFHTATREVKLLRGIQGAIFSLAFASSADKNQPPQLAVAARHYDGDKKVFNGAIWLFDPANEKQRVWNEPLLDVRDMQLKRPGLAFLDKDRLAIAWGDGKMRFWSPQGQITRDAAKFNVVLARNDQTIWAGGMAVGAPYLQAWKSDGTKLAQSAPTTTQAQTGIIPLAASQRGMGPAAFVVYAKTGANQPEVRLHLVDLASGKLVRDLPLWAYNLRMPVVAQGGDHLAVAGQDGDAIAIFNQSDLQVAGVPQPVTLASKGANFQTITFARSEKKLGLLLGNKTPELVFDFSAPGVTGTDAWKAEKPDDAGWQVTPVTLEPSKQVVLDVRAPGKAATRIELAVGERPTASAVLPPVEGRPYPLVAVAMLEIDEPALRIYRGDTGQPLRHLTGHDGVIRWIAFSRDGRFLASTADDQTVCLWSLDPLNADKHSRIAGMVLEGKQKATVARIDAGSPATGKLAVGAVIEKVLLPDGKELAITSARQFYETLWLLKAQGDVRVQAQGQAPVTLPLAPGIVEHHPLATLFIARGDKTGQRHWLAWNPQGPYEAGSPQSRKFIGWHVNPGPGDTEVLFSRADKYQAKYEKPGLLQELIETASLPQALNKLAPPPLADPRIELTLGDDVLDPSRRDRDGQVVVQTAQKVLRVRVHELPHDKLASLSWSLDGEAFKPFDPAIEREWSATLPAKLDRKAHVLRVVAKVPEGRLPSYEQSWTVRILPPAPKLTMTQPARVFADQVTFNLEALAAPGADDQALDIRVVHNGKVIARPGLKIREAIQLAKGQNDIEIIAVNRDADKVSADAETARVALVVAYYPQAPRIQLDDVIPETGGAGIKISSGEAIVAPTKKVRVRGKIVATDAITEAKHGGRDLVGFKVAQRMLDIDELVILKPGSQTVEIAARTANASSVAKVELRWLPPLPRITHLPSKQGQTFYDEGAGPQRVSVSFRLVAPKAGAPIEENFEAVTLLDGKPIDEAPVVDVFRQIVSVTFVPKGPATEVQVQLRSQWQEPVVSQPVKVEYLRPPFAIAFENVPAKTQEPVINLRARVRSALPITSDQVEANVNGRRLRQVQVTAGEGDLWHIDLKYVSLDDRKNSTTAVTLKVRNAEGTSRASAEASMVFIGLPPKRPDLILLEPGSSNLVDNEIDVRFVVRSEAPLQRLTMMLEGADQVQAFDLGNQASPGELRIDLHLTGEGAIAPINLGNLKFNERNFLAGVSALSLAEGLNRLRIEAVNEGGETAVSVVLTVQRPPLRIVLERLESPDGSEAVPFLREGRFASSSPAGKMMLHGKVVFGKVSDPRLAKPEMLHVRVNGSRQIAGVPLLKATPEKPRERGFRATVFLPRSEGNRVSLDLIGLEEDEGQAPFHLVDCRQPVEEKRLLHLLMVAAGESTGDQIKTLVYKAMQARSLSPREFTLPTFERGLTYGPIIGDIEPDQVYFEIANMQRRIQRLANEGAYNHVVMVYFQGGEVSNDKGMFLKVQDPGEVPNPEKSWVSCDLLQARLLDTLGAQILLLDVERDPKSKKPGIADVPGDAKLAVIRTAQLKPGQRKVRLIQAWESSMPRANQLAELESLIAQELRPIVTQNPEAMMYEPHIPADLRDLVIGSGKK